MGTQWTTGFCIGLVCGISGALAGMLVVSRTVLKSAGF